MQINTQNTNTPFWYAEYAEKDAKIRKKYAKIRKKYAYNTQNTQKKYAAPIWNTQNRDTFVFCVFCVRTHSPLC